jgi:hypothetical protein
LFRSIGGSLGTAILGAIFTNRLSHELASQLPAGSPADSGLASGNVNPAQISSLPPAVHDGFVNAFTDSLSTVFLIAAIVVAVAFLLAWTLEERPLRRTIEDRDTGDAFPPPQETDSLREITRELSRLAGRDRTRRFIEGVIQDAHVDMTPAEAWLLGRAEGGAIAEDVLEVPDPGDRLALQQGLVRLRMRDLVESADPPAHLTDAGQTTRRELITARRRSLEYLVADWHPEDPELDGAIARLSEELGKRSRLEPATPAA